MRKRKVNNKGENESRERVTLREKTFPLNLFSSLGRAS